MLRAIWFLLILAGLAAAALWLADHPGSLRLTWQGYVIETSVAMLITAFALVAFSAAILYRFWVFLRRAPAIIGKAREEGRRRRGYLALTRGMVAVAAGDAREARQQGSRADGLLGDPSLTMLLSAQAAQLNGDETAAEKFFTKMLDRPEMEFLGLRGLLSQAIRRGDHGGALKWARRAFQLMPKSEWLGSNLFDLLTHEGEWEEAADTLANAIRNRAVSPVDARRRKAVLNHLISLKAATAGKSSDALKHARKAFDDAANFAPVAVHYAGLLMTGGKHRKAASALEQAWRAQPHPDLAAAYNRAAGATGVEDALAGMKAAQKLCKGNAGHPESLRVLAASALEAELWGEARRHLQALTETPEIPTTVAACAMMAELEERETGNQAAAREWLYKASTASADPVWVCRNCGNTTRDWTPLCGKCHDFDTFDWSLPPNVPGIASARPATLSVTGPTEIVPAVADDDATLLAPPPAALPKIPDGDGSQDIDEKSKAK